MRLTLEYSIRSVWGTMGYVVSIGKIAFASTLRFVDNWPEGNISGGFLFAIPVSFVSIAFALSALSRRFFDHILVGFGGSNQ